MDEEQLESSVVASDPAPSGGLTEQEETVMHHLVAAWEAFIALPTVVSDDHLTAFRMAIHQAQSVLARRVAGRMFPGMWAVIM